MHGTIGIRTPLHHPNFKGRPGRYLLLAYYVLIPFCPFAPLPRINLTLKVRYMNTSQISLTVDVKDVADTARRLGMCAKSTLLSLHLAWFSLKDMELA